MSTYDMIIQEGREQGRQQGIEQGIEQGRQQGIEQGRQQGIEQGRQQGIELGVEKAKEAFIQNMIIKGFELEAISEVVQIPLEFVLQVKDKMKI